jgi:hypothetical protein
VGIVVKHIFKHPKTGRLSFRRAYPPELRSLIPRAAGEKAPREHKVSLGAADINAPGVLARYEKALSDYEAVVALARRVEAGAYDGLDAPMIAYIAKRFEVDWHEEEEKSLASDGAEWAEKRLAGWLWMLDEYKEARVNRDFDLMEEWWGGTARAFLAGHDSRNHTGGTVPDALVTNAQSQAGPLRYGGNDRCEALGVESFHGRMRTHREHPGKLLRTEEGWRRLATCPSSSSRGVRGPGGCSAGTLPPATPGTPRDTPRPPLAPA